MGKFTAATDFWLLVGRTGNSVTVLRSTAKERQILGYIHIYSLLIEQDEQVSHSPHVHTIAHEKSLMSECCFLCFPSEIRKGASTSG